MQRKMHRRHLALVLASLLAACGGGSDSNPATTIAKTGGGSGDGQTATVASALPTQLSVTVMEDGAAKAGATVTWSTVAGSGTVAPTTSVTDAAGLATTTWTLGTIAGAQTARAALSGAGGSPVSFAATGTADAATAFAKSGGDNQNGFPSTVFGVVLGATVKDQFGNGIGGVTVNWAVQSGSATVAGPSSLTDGAGLARIAVTAGATLGAVVVRATNGSVAGNLDFALTVVALPASAAVTVASNSFTSVANATSDPAIDTIGVGGHVTWTVAGGTHTVQSTGNPSFIDSGNLNATDTYQITFPNAGTFAYNCAIHPSQMSGRVVVQ